MSFLLLIYGLQLTTSTADRPPRRVGADQRDDQRALGFGDAREFLRKYKGMVDGERGECTCETDEVETLTIDGSGVILGAHVPRGRRE
jgi:hypothetical protein